MKHLSRVALFVLLLASLSAFADSVNFTNLNVYFTIAANQGFGDNIGGTLIGTNVNFFLSGGTPYNWFAGDTLYAPGSVGGGDTTIYFDFAAGTLGGQYYEGDNAGVTTADFNAGVFTFPTNGKNFTVSVPASLGVVVVTGCTNAGVCTVYNLVSKPGTLVLSFAYSQYYGMYYGASGSFTTTVPEPSTLGLVGIGISVLAACKRKLIRAST
jgi:hypothetical protein